MIKHNYKYDLIIFDCDGTLVDSEMLINQASAEVLQMQSLTKFTPEYCASTFKGISMKDIILLLQNELGAAFNKELFLRNVGEKCNVLINNYIQPIKNAAELLASLKDMPKCVASNGEHERVLHSLQATKLKSFFTDQQIFTYKMVAKGKPAPDLFLYAAEKMGVRAHNCLVIEDSLIGVRAAKAAGMDVIYIKSDAHSKEEEAIKQQSPLAMITDLLEVRNYTTSF